MYMYYILTFILDSKRTFYCVYGTAFENRKNSSFCHPYVYILYAYPSLPHCLLHGMLRVFLSRSTCFPNLCTYRFFFRSKHSFDKKKNCIAYYFLCGDTKDCLLTLRLKIYSRELLNDNWIRKKSFSMLLYRIEKSTKKLSLITNQMQAISGIYNLHGGRKPNKFHSVIIHSDKMLYILIILRIFNRDSER